MRKIIFLDIDGVLNNRETLRKVQRASDMIDPYLVLLVSRIVEQTDAEIVLSSSWRHGHWDKIRDQFPFKLIDRTGSCCAGIRGVEIYEWIRKNVSYQDRDNREKFRYAILDDEGDMLLWQKDHFFKTSFETGLTEEIAEKVVNHLNN